MSSNILTKKVQELEKRVSILELGDSSSHTPITRRGPVRTVVSGSYEALARIKGILSTIKGENPVRYQRRVRRESDRKVASS